MRADVASLYSVGHAFWPAVAWLTPRATTWFAHRTAEAVRHNSWRSR